MACEWNQLGVPSPSSLNKLPLEDFLPVYVSPFFLEGGSFKERCFNMPCLKFCHILESQRLFLCILPLILLKCVCKIAGMFGKLSSLLETIIVSKVGTPLKEPLAYPWKSKTKERLVFRMSHIRDSLLPRDKVWSAWTSPAFKNMW